MIEKKLMLVSSILALEDRIPFAPNTSKEFHTFFATSFWRSVGYYDDLN
ncbi:MAG: hypothetical protein QXH51_06385 [Candidatus Bathyarchaeia archaeon]